MLAAAIDKARVLEALRSSVNEKLLTLTCSQTTAQAGAIHEETRQEDPKDTRAIEAQYLARGLAQRVETLRDTQAALASLRLQVFGPNDPIGLTALVTVVGNTDEESLYFLAPSGCSERLALDGATIQVLAPNSPLGSALVGRCGGDEIEIDLPTGPTRAEIVSVA